MPATMDGLVDGDPLVITREVFLRGGVRARRPARDDGRPGAHRGQPPARAGPVPGPDRRAGCPAPTSCPTASTADAAPPGRRRRVRRHRLRADRRPALRGSTRSPPTSPTTPARSPGSCCVQRPGPLPAPTGADKTTVTAVIADRTGALLDLLAEFAVRGISLTRIESRPTRERLGVYSFSIDCEGHVADARVGDALAALHRLCAERALPRLLPAGRRRRGQAGRGAGRATPRSPARRPGWPGSRRDRRSDRTAAHLELSRHGRPSVPH